MRIRYTLHVVGILMLFLGITMVLPLLFGLYYQDGSVVPIAQSIAVTLAGGLLLFVCFR